MFKRVARRQKRKEEEEELGLNEEMKEVMGLQDTDSSESDSSSDDGSSDEETRTTRKSLPMKRKRKSGSDEADESDGASGAEAEAEDYGEDHTDDEESIGLGDVNPEEGSSDDELLMTISQALKDPLYLVSVDPEIRACVVCPNKMLKNPKMIEIHITSNAHKRRFKRLRELAVAASPDVDVGDILVELEKEKEDSKPSEDPVAQSKRAEKRRAKQTALRAKRLKQKEVKAKVAARKKEKQAFKRAKTSLRDSTSSAPEEKKAEKERKVAKEKKQDRKIASPTKKADKKSKSRYFDEVKSLETEPGNAKQSVKKMKGTPKKKSSGHGGDKTMPKSAEKQTSKKKPKTNQTELQVFD